MAVIRIDHVTKSFGDVTVLKEFTEVFRDGEFITLLGPSGCGKTTMLRMIAGFEKPTSGEIKIDELTVNGRDIFVPPERREIGMVFQSYAVWPHMNVFDNVAYPLRIQKIPKAEIEKKVVAVLEIVHLTQYAGRMPSQLSGGQQQRVALGRALVAEPKLLLLDEPLSNLDAKLRESMRYEIKAIQKKLGINVIYVTHDQIEAMTMSDRVFVINRGIVQQVGTPIEIYRKPANQFIADFVGKVNFIKGSVTDEGIRLKDMEDAVLPYDGEVKGDCIVAFRPENVSIAKRDEEGQIAGEITSTFFLGDVTDCQVAAGKAMIRVTADSYAYDVIRPAQKIRLAIRDFLVYRDEGNEDYGEILT
ncbi:MAG: ABC transporter ATP-binding protein [Fusobacteriaceae bacterium]|jgi:iron(III) transport system ATP-binding protein|nr:ABC transporter ATP-binding protein [Fusobacteriaceae bacterium]